MWNCSTISNSLYPNVFEMHAFIRSVEAFSNLKVSARFKFQNFNLACKSILLPPCPSHILTSAFRWIPADCADSQKSFTSCVVPFPISLSLSFIYLLFFVPCTRWSVYIFLPPLLYPLWVEWNFIFTRISGNNSEFNYRIIACNSFKRIYLLLTRSRYLVYTQVTITQSTINIIWNNNFCSHLTYRRDIRWCNQNIPPFGFVATVYTYTVSSLIR